MSLHHGLDEISAPDLPNFSVGHIILRSLWITLWNFVPFLFMALVISVPVLVVVLGVAHYTDLAGRIDFVDGRIASSFADTLTFLGVAFVVLVMFLMIQAAVAYRSFRALGGTRAGFGACFIRSLGVMLHLGEFAIVASILLGAVAWVIFSETSWLLADGQQEIAIFFGILLLGVFLFIIAGCWVVFPAIVIERIGPVTAILRSWRLTRGHRWGILILLALFIALEWAIFSLIHVEIEITLVGPYAVVLLNVPLAFLGAVVMTASYYNLVGEKDGMTALSRIFV